jgi:chromosome segregation protein
MQFDKLRIVGFKSFVDPTEFVIERGLTGVVGPNGCGKSNLVEALRWVMGETSFKSMRASAMDDVIFNGSGGRPQRNTAEVMLAIDNSARTAPASFNDADKLEISRQITREEGSAYRINGREARARDVQILFADAATGARSPALVRQGQIGEIISAKPQARRRILEDAAGIAGLHARRHEAELRLKGAEDNITRVEDVLRHIDSQVESLSRQAKQAVRYRDIAAQIRQAEAMVLHIAFHEAKGQLQAAERQLDADTRAVAERTRLQGEAARALAVAEHDIQPLRDEEVRRAAALQRLQIAREQIDAEEARAKARSEELKRRLDELTRDRERVRQGVDDAARSLALLASEAERLEMEGTGDVARRPAAQAHLAHVEADLAKVEQALSDSQGALADLSARRNAAERAVREASERLARAENQLAEADREIAAIGQAGAGVAGGVQDLVVLRGRYAEASTAFAAAESLAQRAEAELAKARETETQQRPRLNDAERNSQRLETEIRTLKKLFDTGASDLWPAVLEEISVAKGYEVALGAALGDDLDASSNPSAPAHWALAGDGADDPMLPPQAAPLADHVTAPPALARRLRQIGVVARAEGAALRRLLKPGQRLVSREGDLWRWDGYTTAAEAPSHAARRLAEKNRLGDLEKAAVEARAELTALKLEAEQAQQSVRLATANEQDKRAAVRLARIAMEQARDVLAAAERRDAERAARLQALQDNRLRLVANRDDHARARAASEGALTGFQPDAELSAIVADRRTVVVQRRADAAEARAALQTIEREITMRAQRRATIANEQAAWTDRRTRAEQQALDISARVQGVENEQAQLAASPDDHVIRRRALAYEIEQAEAARKAAADSRAALETTLAEAGKIARITLTDLSTAREARARAEALVESAALKVVDVEKLIGETLEVAPVALANLAGLVPGQDLPPLRASEDKLVALKRERERLGAVNLRADEELQEAEQRRTDLVAEREDLEGAIRKFRRAIASLNAEGRERLLASFEVVNSHFKRLFATLFGGGEAELQLVESDDPLEAGLEILAKPPGKKPQVLTLLSGGEQALTATALIFAVFLTNPSPICVLDEIDAPLDDHNVERLCDLLDEMVKTTMTRFIIITHNPITMARMDRLYGVTMAERGISQLVSVDLTAAEKLVA